MTEATVSIASLISTVGEVFTGIMGWVGEVGAKVVSQPLLLFACVGLPLAGVGIAFFKRLLRTRV